MKLPWFKFFPKTWISDTELSKCEPETRGIWMDLVCAMDMTGRGGEITGTIKQLSKISRCTPTQFSRAIKELESTKTADVTFCNTDVTPTVTVVNRKMKRELKDRQATALRVKKHRSNANVTLTVTHKKKEDRSKMIDNTGIQKTNTEQPAPVENSVPESKRQFPTLEKVKEVFKQKGGTEEMAVSFWEGKQAVGWAHRGNQIKDFSWMVPNFIRTWKEIRQEKDNSEVKKMVM